MLRPLATLAAALLPAMAAAAETGVARLTLDAPHHGRPMQTTVWYPGTGGDPVAYGENPVFHGTLALEGARPTPGPHPVVLLSHGLGGHAGTLTWLADGLVQRGAVVIGVDHPKDSLKNLPFFA